MLAQLSITEWRIGYEVELASSLQQAIAVRENVLLILIQAEYEMRIGNICYCETYLLDLSHILRRNIFV